MAFLTAVWSNLCLVTYPVEPGQLQPRLPDGFELDTLDGQAFVSLVAFDFLQTRVKGIKWPGFVNFPEINLRFYVRDPSGRRGVMFVRELVPSGLIAWVARTIYNEPYAATPMRSNVSTEDGTMTVAHDWSWEGRAHSLRVTADAAAKMPPESSTEHFFKEHQWGFGISRGGKTLVYEVRHPHWKVHEVNDLELDVDMGQLYGAEFAGLNDIEPYSVVLAAGSEIEVYPASVLE